jgi:cell division protein FtsI (penicillin-binding protein 3)
MRPYVVKAIVDKNGGIVQETSPKLVRRVLSYQTAERVARILEDATSDSGTGAPAAISGFRVAGKTGTAQKVDPHTKMYSKKKYVATFVGFAPVDRPELVILVVIDEPQGIAYGGVVAAPVFRQVGLWSLNHLRVNPQMRLVDKKMDVPADSTKKSGSGRVQARPLKVKAGLVPDFKGLGMREVVKKGRTLGLKVLLEGTGLAVTQYPKPGSSLQRVSTVRVSFKPPT